MVVAKGVSEARAAVGGPERVQQLQLTVGNESRAAADFTGAAIKQRPVAPGDPTAGPGRPREQQGAGVIAGDLGIADNILLDRLRRLVDAGVLVKVPYHDGRRTRQEYRLTQAGADLSPILRALGEWGAEHTAGAAPAQPMRAIHAQRGGELSADWVCATCGTRVDRDQEAWIRPWRSPTPQPLAAPVRTPGADGD